MPGEILSAPRLALTRETVEELSRQRQEPEWLRAVRRRAFEAFERLPIPDQHTEGWRRTNLRGLPIDAVDPLGGSDAPVVPRAHDALSEQAGATLFEFGRGIPVHQGSGHRVQVLELQSALQDPDLAARIEKHFSTVVQPHSDKFTALHYAFFNAALVVHVPRGQRSDAPIWINHDFGNVHTLLIADDESEVTVVEDYRGGASGIASGVVEQVVGANAHVRYVQLQRWAADVWSFSWQRAHLGRDASLKTLNVALGARTARNTVQVVLDGRGSQADLLGVVDGHGRQYVDFQTLQEHFGDATRSDLVIHNALRDRSSANFTGLIRINTSAHQTESSQEQKNILLSERSKADSDPKLEILNNDVIRCTHGAAVGPVDQEMIFYLESRGLDQATAEQLIVEGFFQSTLKKLGLPRVEEALWSAIAEHEAVLKSANA
ncbi:MAG TPA: Fe-S cluster assembly protein SufD [Chloroflexota bacterium]|nr:Fe-S cluster assembly protein SufD [Chloroflexota bacterium]